MLYRKDGRSFTGDEVPPERGGQLYLRIAIGPMISVGGPTRQGYGSFASMAVSGSLPSHRIVCVSFNIVHHDHLFLSDFLTVRTT
jgi:hypothetical protein